MSAKIALPLTGLRLTSCPIRPRIFFDMDRARHSVMPASNLASVGKLRVICRRIDGLNRRSGGRNQSLLGNAGLIRCMSGQHCEERIRSAVLQVHFSWSPTAGPPNKTVLSPSVFPGYSVLLKAVTSANGARSAYSIGNPL